MGHPLSKSERIGKDHERPFGRQGLFEFDTGQSISFGAENGALRAARRSFSFLVSANGIGAAREKPFVEGKIICRIAKTRRNAMADPQAQIATASQRMIP